MISTCRREGRVTVAGALLTSNKGIGQNLRAAT